MPPKLPLRITARPEGSVLPISTPKPSSAGGPRYEIQHLIGSGGMGVVYRALDRELNRPVALKIIRDDLAADSRHVARLKREVTLSSRVSEEHVVRVHDLTEIDGKLAIVMQWVEGRTLSQVVSRVHCLPPSQVWDFAVQIALGLRAIHRAGIAHCDLKPGNLLISPDGRILVSDFGLARSTLSGDSSSDMDEASAGTPRYMAPEQLSGLPADCRSDIYAFGLVLLFMLTGATEPDGLRAVSLGVAQEEDKHARRKENQKLAILRWVIGQCLERTRSERLASAEAVIEALHVSEHELGKAGLGMRVRVPRVGAILLVPAVAVGLGWYLWRGKTGVGSSADVSAERLYALGVSGLTERSAEPELRSALDALDQALLRAPTFSPAANARVEALIRLYETTLDLQWLAKAHKALDGASALDPKRRKILEARIDLLSGSYPGVIGRLKGDADLLATSTDANRLLGRALEESGKPAEALAYFEEAVRLSPQSWLGHNELGSLLLDSGHPEESIRHFQKVTELQPESAVGYSNLGAANLRLGRIPKARENFERSLRLRPMADTYQDVGAAAYYDGQFVFSVPYFRAASEMQPSNDRFAISLGDALRHSGQDSAAREAYLRGIGLFKGTEQRRALTVKELCRKARAYAHLGDVATAKTVLDAAVRMEPGNPMVDYTAAVVALMEGRNAAAGESLRRSVQHGYPEALARHDPDLDRLFR